MCDASDNDSEMRDASVPAPIVEPNVADNANVLPASELFKSGAGTNNAQIHQSFMMNQNALAADIADNGEVGGTQVTTKAESVDIKNDFLGRQMAEQGMTSFGLKEYCAKSIAQYHGPLILPLTKEAMSMDPTLKRAEALSADKINLG